MLGGDGWGAGEGDEGVGQDSDGGFGGTGVLFGCFVVERCVEREKEVGRRWGGVSKGGLFMGRRL